MGHQTSLTYALEHAGFVQVRPCRFGDSSDEKFALVAEAVLRKARAGVGAPALTTLDLPQRNSSCPPHWSESLTRGLLADLGHAASPVVGFSRSRYR